jgi:hypothetical protein
MTTYVIYGQPIDVSGFSAAEVAIDDVSFCASWPAPGFVDTILS